MKNARNSKILLAGVAAGSFFLSSCDSNEIDLDRNLFSEDVNENTSDILRVNLSNLNTSQQDNIRYLSNFAKDLRTSPIVAKAYNNSPKDVLALYNLSDYNLQTDDIGVRAALAIGDSEIQKAIKDKYVNRCLSLMYDKGFLNNNEFEQTKAAYTSSNSAEISEAIVAVYVALLGIAVGAYIIVVVDVGFWGYTDDEMPSVLSERVEAMDDFTLKIKDYNDNSTFYLDSNIPEIKDAVEAISLNQLYLDDEKKQSLVNIACSIYNN